LGSVAQGRSLNLTGALRPVRVGDSYHYLVHHYQIWDNLFSFTRTLMKALILSGILLFFWVCGYYMWDYSQFQKHTPFITTKSTLFVNNQTGWTDFFDSYSFTMTPTETCSENCCLQWHLLQFELDHPNLPNPNPCPEQLRQE
jgi:hypothetical protein